MGRRVVRKDVPQEPGIRTDALRRRRSPLHRPLQDPGNRRHPAIARQYALEGIDPFALAQETGTSPSLATESLRSRLRRLIALYPEGFQARRLAAETALEAQAYRRALSHAQAMVRNFPESPEGYVLQGDAYKGLRVHQQALTSYRKALARSRPERRARIYRKMGSVSMELQRYAEAYRVLKRGVSPYGDDVTFRDIFNLAIAAERSGRTKEAVRLLRYAYRTVPSADEAWKARIRRHLERLERLGTTAEGVSHASASPR